MNWNRSWGPDEEPSHHAHAPFLVHMMEAIYNLNHATGRIEQRLEQGDAMFQEIRKGLGDLKTELAAMKSPPRPSRLADLRALIQTCAPLVKEAWPFLALAAAAVAKWLGFDLSGMLGPPSVP